MSGYTPKSIQELIEHWDDPAARARLTTLLHDQLRLKASIMLHRDFARLQGMTETQSIVDRALTQILGAASLSPEKVRPKDAHHFIELVGNHMSFELLKLVREAKKYLHFGDTAAASDNDDSNRSRGPEEWQQDQAAFANTYDPVTLAKWGEFHEAVQSLPIEERRVVQCLWYLDMNQAEAAEALGINPRQVSRLWAEARNKLANFM